MKICVWRSDHTGSLSTTDEYKSVGLLAHLPPPHATITMSLWTCHVISFNVPQGIVRLCGVCQGCQWRVHACGRWGCGGQLGQYSTVRHHTTPHHTTPHIYDYDTHLHSMIAPKTIHEGLVFSWSGCCHPQNHALFSICRHALLCVCVITTLSLPSPWPRHDLSCCVSAWCHCRSLKVPPKPWMRVLLRRVGLWRSRWLTCLCLLSVNSPSYYSYFPIFMCRLWYVLGGRLLPLPSWMSWWTRRNMMNTRMNRSTLIAIYISCGWAITRLILIV